MSPQQNIRVNVQRLEQIGPGRIKVKIAETSANINTLTHNGKIYETAKNLGRGRYIMKEAGA